MSALRPNAAKWCQTATAAPNDVKWQVCNLNLKKVHLIYILLRLLDEFYHCPVPTFFVLICAFFCNFVVGLRSRDDNKKCSLYSNLFTLFFISGFCTLMFVGWILYKKEKMQPQKFAPHLLFLQLLYFFQFGNPDTLNGPTLLLGQAL